MDYLELFKNYVNQQEATIFCINVRAVPKSNKTEITDYLLDGSWKIRVKAIPENNQANLAIEKYLQKILKVKQVEVILGKQDRLKVIRISKNIQK